MVGFQNVEDGIRHFFQHLETAHPDVQKVFTFLENSAKALLSEDAPELEAAKTAMLAALSGALEGGDKTAAGKAIIAATKAAGSKLSDDALHILATDVLAI